MKNLIVVIAKAIITTCVFTTFTILNFYQSCIKYFLEVFIDFVSVHARLPVGGRCGIMDRANLHPAMTESIMKVFISWSGNASKGCALALKKVIESVFNGVEPWMSAEDIKPGQQWFTELMNVLGETRFAIVCLTRSNMRAPWVMFEAGAVSAHFGELKVAPLLLEGALWDSTRLEGPMLDDDVLAFSPAEAGRRRRNARQVGADPRCTRRCDQGFGGPARSRQDRFRAAGRCRDPLSRREV